MPSFEQCFDRNEPLHSVIIPIAAYLHQNQIANAFRVSLKDPSDLTRSFSTVLAPLSKVFEERKVVELLNVMRWTPSLDSR